MSFAAQRTRSRQRHVRAMSRAIATPVDRAPRGTNVDHRARDALEVASLEIQALAPRPAPVVVAPPARTASPQRVTSARAARPRWFTEAGGGRTRSRRPC
jgi:hypothetical protein